MAWTAPRTWVATDVLPAAQLNTDIRDNEEFLKSTISPDATTELIINAGSITVTQSYHTVDTQADAAEDDLDTIAGVSEGMIVILRAEHTDRTVVVKNGTGNIICGGDIYLDDVNKHVALICDDSGDMNLLYTWREVVFMVNAFQYPAPGTDWTPELNGAGLAASLAAKKVWLPLNFLKIGDSIISYTLNGDATETAALTLNCKLVSIDLADPIGTTDVPGGDIVQVDATGNFSVEAVLTDPEVIVADKQYVLEILGTTGVGDSITVMGAEVVIRRLV